MPTTGILDREYNLPYWIEAGTHESGPAAAISWWRANEELVNEALLKHGAIFFRGFAINTPAAFAQFTRGMRTPLLEAIEENVPRTKLASGIYTSTEYPAEYTLSMHSEYSYASKWPSKLYFCCIVAPKTGGETPIADNRKILQALDPAIVDEFRRKGISYIRNLHDKKQGFGLSWQEAFQTEDRSVVEDYCLKACIELRWKDSYGVSLIQTRPAVITHPRTAEQVWFNQAPQFHPSDYPKEIHESLLMSYQGNPDDLPQNVRFGDSSHIDESALAHVRETMIRHAVLPRWEEGDLMVVDNVLTCHGRMPFSGPRKILVAMSEC